MTTGTSGHGTAQKSREHINQLRAAQALKDRRRQRRIRLTWLGVTVAVIGIVVAMMLTSRQETSATRPRRTGFTLTGTSGSRSSLAGLRGPNVLLSLPPRAPAASPAPQSRWPQIEKDPAFAAEGLTVLPIVMNSHGQIPADMEAKRRHAHHSCSTTGPCPRPTAPWARACTPGSPATASF